MLNSIVSTPLTIFQLLVVLISSFAFGLLLSIVFSFRNKESASLSLCLVIMPMAMGMLVLLINGNLGVAVALVGGFSIVKFRSVQGSGREICALYAAMTVGVICGMGYITMAAIFFIIVSIVVIVLTIIGFGENQMIKTLKITIPEDYDYDTLFDDIFEKYQIKARLDTVRTISLGSLIELTYEVTLKAPIVKKEMLDELRTRNCNLSIVVSNANEKRTSL